MKYLLALLALVCSIAHAGLVDLKFGQSQIADSQWNVNACLNTTTCQIYSKNPGVAYKIPWTNGQLSWSAGDYVKFEANMVSGAQDSNNPWTARQYASNGTLKATMGAGHIVNMGNDFFFFVGSDNNTGQLFSMTTGMVGTGGITWTGTRNPTVTQVNTLAAGGSTTPLAAGQSASPPPPQYTSSITTQQQGRVNAWNSRAISNSEIYIEQIGNYNNMTVRQEGTKNALNGIGQRAAQVHGDSNTITVRQGGSSDTNKNQVELRVVGSSNTLSINQSVDALGTYSNSTNGHYGLVDVNGTANNITTVQQNSGGIGSQYMETTVTGNNNTVNNQQLNNGNKIMFTSVTGNNNSVTATQQGTGQHYLDVKLTGNGNSVNALQDGTTQNRATVDLTNSGGPSSLNLTQTGGQTYSLQQSCATPSGCSTTIRQ